MKPMKLLFPIAFSLLANSSFASQSLPEINTVNGVANYPAGYQGTPKRAVGEDPFLSPENSALILIDYQHTFLWECVILIIKI